MDAASAERKIGVLLPKFCLASVIALALAYSFGGLTTTTTPSLLQNFSRQFFTLYILLVPILFIAYLFYIEYLRTQESKRATSGTTKLLYDDAFDLPSQDMHGYKIAFLSGEIPTLTGLTGDLYVADDMAKCEMNRDHVPPVAGCDCGFYAYSDIKTAAYQLSINPTSFLIDVDLFGVGFAYSRGFRAESQVVNFMSLPRRCMRCKVLKPEQFVKSYKFGFNSYGYWRWEFRCKVCSYNFKEKDCLSPEKMSQALGIKMVR
jgi:hypothetical protein